MKYFDPIYATDLPHRAWTVYRYLKSRANRDGIMMRPQEAFTI